MMTITISRTILVKKITPWNFVVLALLSAVVVTSSSSTRRCGVSALSTRNSVRTQSRHLPETPRSPFSSRNAGSSSNNSSSGASTDGSCGSDNNGFTEPGFDNDGNLPLREGGRSVLDRKQALRSLAVAAGMTLTAAAPEPSEAFDRSFPTELADDDNYDGPSAATGDGGGVLIGRRSTVAQRKQAATATKQKLDQNLASFGIKTDALPSMVWGLAIFFASGSRSNPLATPLANLIYEEESEQWLEDRNAGLFGPLPVPFLGLLGIVFLLLGTVTQYALLQLSGGDSGVCGQLAGVALINGGFFEIGRIASGEKKLTKEENDRAVMLDREFDDFARTRLQPGGNCHRSDVVRSFRRFNPKYRFDSEQYPLTDREIEKLLREWNGTKNPHGKAEMRSTGFYYGIQINKDADVFL